MINYPQNSGAIEMFLGSCTSVEKELNCELKVTAGEIPPTFSGTLYRNGAGRFKVGDDAYSHFFDGDGMVSSFQFRRGKVFYKNAYVKTSEFQQESMAKRMLFRGFGSNIPGGLKKNFLRTRFKNAANTNVVFHGAQLYALWEGGPPHRLDPESLETIDRYNFRGKLANSGCAIDKWINPQLPFSAHPKIDPVSGALYNFGLAFGVESRLMIYRVDANGKMAAPNYLNLKKLSFIHDFLITAESKAIFFATPVHFRLLSMLSGRSTPAASMVGDPRAQIQIIVIDLKKIRGTSGKIPPSSIEIFDAPHAFIFHHVNAFETNGEIHIYSAEMESFPSAKSAESALRGEAISYPLTQLTRYVLKSSSRQAVKLQLPIKGFEMPRIDDSKIGLSFSSFFCAGVSDLRKFPFLDQIQKVSTDGKQVCCFSYADGLVGEPVVANSVGPQMLLTLCYNHRKRKSELIILGAENLELVAKVELPHSQPIGFHGSWVSNLDQPLAP